jgi:hypothetical protein
VAARLPIFFGGPAALYGIARCRVNEDGGKKGIGYKRKYRYFGTG